MKKAIQPLLSSCQTQALVITIRFIIKRSEGQERSEKRIRATKRQRRFPAGHISFLLFDFLVGMKKFSGQKIQRTNSPRIKKCHHENNIAVMGGTSSKVTGGPLRKSQNDGLPNEVYCCMTNEDELNCSRYPSNHALECWGSRGETRSSTQKHHSGGAAIKTEVDHLHPELGSLKKFAFYPPLVEGDSMNEHSPSSPGRIDFFDINRASMDSTTSQNSDKVIQRITSWDREPEPLTNWTLQEQRVLISELKEYPLARRQPEILQKLFYRTQKMLPQKSMDDIQACYRHLEVMRIANFGGTNSRRTSVGIYPQYPHPRSSRTLST